MIAAPVGWLHMDRREVATAADLLLPEFRDDPVALLCGVGGREAYDVDKPAEAHTGNLQARQDERLIAGRSSMVKRPAAMYATSC